MAEQPNESNAGGGSTGTGLAPGSPGPAAGVERPAWGQIWQMPVLLLGLALLATGLTMVLLSPRPKVDYTGDLQAATRFIDARQFDKAAEKLNAVRLQMDKMSKVEQGVYHLLSGDLTWNQVQSEPFKYDTEENRRGLLGEYVKARDLGATIDAAHWRRWAMVLVSLGHYDEAIKTLDRLAGEPPEQRYLVLRDLIERRRSQGEQDQQGVAKLLERFREELTHETDAGKRRQQEVWAFSLQGKMLLDAGQPQEAINLLLLQLGRLGGEGKDLVPMMVQLATAYQQVGDQTNARQWFVTAQKTLKGDVSDPLNADVLVGLARVTLSDTGDIREALDLFSKAESTYPATPAYFDALVGRADCEARMGSDDQALEHFGGAVKAMTDAHLSPAGRVSSLAGIIQGHYDDCSEKGNYNRAMDYLTLAAHLYKDLPPAVLQDFAVTHEKIAETRLQDAQATSVKSDDQAELLKASDAKKLAYQEAAIHFGQAADYYFKHAQAVTVTADQAYGDSLWAAANDYDRAQLWKQAIDVYIQYVRTRNNDRRQLEATNHLGLAYMADGQYLSAESLFKDLIDRNPNSPEAYKSLVPLARCYIAKNQVDDALRVLRHVVTDHPIITRQSQEYHDALVELGKLLYQQGQYVEAIEQLSIAVDRYGETPQGAVLRFRLADAYRQSVGELDKELKEPLTQSARAATESERRNRLDQAKVLFSQVISALEARDPQSLSPVEQLFERNAYFYEADCAYDMGQYEHAISLYDRAAKRWDNQPASLVALVQIVNAYCELGAVQEARVTNERARAKLKQLPDKVFDDPSLPMTRKHWEDWLKWSSQLEAPRAQASAAGSN